MPSSSCSLKSSLIIAFCGLALIATLIPLTQRRAKMAAWDSTLEDWFEENFLFI